MKPLILALSFVLPSLAFAWDNHCEEQVAQWAVEDAVIAKGPVCSGGSPAIVGQDSIYTPGGRGYETFHMQVRCSNGVVFTESFDTGGSPSDCYKAYFGE